MIYKLIIFFTMVLFITGCTTPVVHDTKIVYRDKSILINPPDAMLEVSEIPKPPDKNKFMTSSNSNRIHMLTDYSVTLMKILSTTNNKLISLKKWKDKQINIYGDKSNDK